MEKTKPTCKDCIYFKSVSGYTKQNGVITSKFSNKLFCCRRSPDVVHGWPTVSSGDWCGEISLTDEYVFGDKN